MWTAPSQSLSDGRGIRTTINANGAVISYAEVLRLWRDDAEFRGFFIDLLAGSPYTAFRWETPPITSATVGKPFEFVLLNSPGLASHPDLTPFAAYLRGPGAESGVVEFRNLGNDATLVVPCPIADHSAYGHLAAFLRRAPDPQKHALWERVGRAVERRLGSAPVWVSTAGAGVSWLHVRLDDRPKYYGYAPYRAAPDSA